jgi:two-component system, LytTR family, sensor kinase
MAKKLLNNFYFAQIVFWLCFTIYAILPALIVNEYKDITIERLGTIIIGGIVLSTIYKIILDKIKFRYNHMPSIIMATILGVFFTNLIYEIIMYKLYNNYLQEVYSQLKVSVIRLLLADAITNMSLVLPWFFVFHLIKFVKTNYKTEKQLLETENLLKTAELQNITNKINPHFLFNTINTIKWLVKTEPNKARQALDGISTILRSNLYQQNKFVSIEQELSMAQEYLQIEKLRFEERLQYSLQCSTELYSQSILPFTIINLIENAAKHGIAKLVNGGKINCTITKQANNIIIQVENDGAIATAYNNNGIGNSTMLALLKSVYGNNANMTLMQINDNKVIATIQYPCQP